MKPHATVQLLQGRSYLKNFPNLLSLFAFLLSFLALLHFSHRHHLPFYSSSLAPSPSSYVLPQSLSPLPSPSSVLTSLSPSASTVSVSSIGANYTAEEEEDCDISKGEWVLDSAAGDYHYYYTNSSCRMIQDHQNCIKHGRPDMDFLRWRWRPNDCELPRFDPRRFLELLRGELYQNIAKEINKWKDLLKHYLKSVDEEIEVILKFEEICLETATELAPLFSIILSYLYEKDILSEDAILSWASEKEGADESDKIFVKQSESFITWLKEASEEEDE